MSFSSLPLSDVLFPFADGGLEGEEERVRKEVDDADDVADPVVEEDEDAMALDLKSSESLSLGGFIGNTIPVVNQYQ